MTPHRDTRLDRFLAAIPFVVGLLAVLAFLFWQAAARKTPTIFGDELEWTQLSRAIAATGHAARRGEPISFKSLYAFLIAPAWWIHSTATAYSAIKYLNAVVMTLTAVPVYFLARPLVGRRVATVVGLASVCTSAAYYAGFLLPEVLAYPMFALCALTAIRALSGAGLRWWAAAVVLALVAPLVRGELIVVPAALAIASAVVFVASPVGKRLRRGWSLTDHLGVALLLVLALIVLNKLASPHASQWADVTQHWQGRMWSLGMQAASALAIGLGVLPAAAGLAALWLPERRGDPTWRAFAAYTASAIVVVWLYTAVKAAYLSTVFATRVEERNMIYLGPLLLVGTAVYFTSRRPWLPGSLAGIGFVSWLVLYYGYQLDYPYFEAPGYGIAALANRDFHWTQHDIRLALVVACVVCGVVLVVPLARRLDRRVVGGVAAAAALAAGVWMLAGEITSSNGTASASRSYLANLPQPPDWIDRATGRRGTTFLGQNITNGEALGINLMEFWNRSLDHVYSLDGTAPGPGPTLTPDLAGRTGRLTGDPNLPYVVATQGVDLVGPTVASRPRLVLTRVPNPWRLEQTVYGISDDGWSSSGGDSRVADATYAYFDRGAGTGRLKVVVSRAGFCAPTAPGAHVLVRVGPLALNEQRAAVVTRTTHLVRFALRNCHSQDLTFTVTPPVAVAVRVWPTVRPRDYGISDDRYLGAQLGFAFTPTR